VRRLPGLRRPAQPPVLPLNGHAMDHSGVEGDGRVARRGHAALLRPRAVYAQMISARLGRFWGSNMASETAV
jgi:hypothetical protein